MNGNQPTLEEWSRLYEAAVKVKEMAPWEWMTEADIFGVQDPETEVLGFVSVLGMLGEHYAVSVYPGPEALYKFWDFQDIGPFAAPESLLEIPQLQASFENRNMLRQDDREIIKTLGFKFRGQHAWPLFRSYRPGFVPWFLETEEARFLAYGLEQVLEVALRFRENPSLLQPSDDERYLVRVARREGGTLNWVDQTMDVPPPEPSSISIPMDLQALEHLKSLTPSKNTLEIDFFMTLSGVREEKGSRPFYPYMLLVVDSRSGMPLSTELLRADPSLEAMWGQVPVNVVYQLASAGLVPMEVRVRSPLLVQLLQPLASELRFRINQVNALPALDPAKEFLLQVVSR